MNLKDIFFVVVLYKTNLEDSKTINSLAGILKANINLFVFDNSPVRQYENDNFQFKCFMIDYQHDATNPGLSIAYNTALRQCVKLNKKWILLLDQDTLFSKNYIKELEYIFSDKVSESVVAITPKVVSFLDNKMIAPVKMFLGGICRPTNVESGVINCAISGINSGTILNVFYINSINGFSENYTLDMLDHWYFRKIFNDNKSVYLMRSKIYQDLSVFGNFEENVSINRYKQMLNAEVFFVKEEGFLSLSVFKFRLILRVFKQYNFKSDEYYKFTLKCLLGLQS